jgi:uncharacterized protein YndB with AHSA1/START domain
MSQVVISEDSGRELAPVYERRASVAAPAEAAFDAVTTLAGLRGWWTALVSGASDRALGELRFEFAGLDEHIVMRVEEVRKSAFVRWTCLEHTSLPEWNGTQVTFSIEELRTEHCAIILRHIGVAPDWDHFFASLVSYVERGTGTPFVGAAARRRERA